MFRGRKLVAFSISALIALGACARGGNMILEKNDVQFFTVSESHSTSTDVLEVSGLAFHSSLVVKSYTVTKSGDTLIVLVQLIPTRAGMSGSFDYKIPIPDGVNTVVFGNDQAVIWKKGQKS